MLDDLRLFDVIQSDGIVFRLQADDRDQVLLELVRRMVSTSRIHPKVADEIYLSILKREAVSSTGIGNGVAVPHIRTKLVDRFQGALGLSRRGVDFGGPERVHVVFLFLTPERHENDHLLLMGRIGALFVDREFRDRLLASKDEDDLEHVLRTAEERLYGGDNDAGTLVEVR